jgi:hypothetical protein
LVLAKTAYRSHAINFQGFQINRLNALRPRCAGTRHAVLCACHGGRGLQADDADT